VQRMWSSPIKAQSDFRCRVSLGVLTIRASIPSCRSSPRSSVAPGVVGSFRQSDEHATRSQEHVATVGEARSQSQYALKPPAQDGLDLCHFSKAHLGARAQYDRTVTEHEGGSSTKIESG